MARTKQTRTTIKRSATTGKIVERAHRANYSKAKKRLPSRAKSIAEKKIQAKRTAKVYLKPRSLSVASRQPATTVKKTTKKIISKAPKPVFTDEEKVRIKEERELEKAERLRIKEEKAKIKAEKERIKAEKLKMWELNPNKAIPDIKTNPFNTFEKGKPRTLPGKGCCIFCNNREALQCVHAKDIKGLKQSFSDVNNISNPFQPFGIDCNDDLIKAVIKSQDFELFQTVIDQKVKEKRSENFKRVKLPQVALTKSGTGYQNKYNHNFPMRQVKLSRGGKDGNNAFTYDGKIRKRMDTEPSDILKLSPPLSFVKYMLNHKQDDAATGPIKTGNSSKAFLNKRDLSKFWTKAVRKGDYNLVRFIFQQNVKEGLIYLNKMHTNAILQGKEAETVRILKRNSLLKQSSDDSFVLPAHIACINPDPTILQVFFRFYPTSLQIDSKGRDLIHYAVMNRNPDVLSFLISKRQIVNNTDNDGMTPLMLACKYGKTKAVQQLLEDQEKQKKLLDKKDKDFDHYESFFSYVKTIGPYQNTPLHYAMKSGSLAIVKALVEAGAPLDVKNFYNDTPLSVACQKGYLDIADYLLKKDANIHGVDKQQRSPLIRACQNGQIHIVSLLLRRGVNSNFSDLSENTALHHACAYGWLDIVRLLVEHGKAEVNRLNEWKSSPTIIAMLKGHFRIVDYLLARNDVDASMVDDEGRSLVSQLCLNLNEDSVKNLKFLLQKNKINVQTKTTEGLSPLHILAMNDIQEIAKDAIVQKGEAAERKPQYFMRRGKRIQKKIYAYNRYNDYNNMRSFVFEDDRKEYDQLLKSLKETQIKCAELLIKAGNKVEDLTSRNTGEQSPLFLAVQSHNYELAEFFLTKSDQISGKTEEKDNVLHLVSDSFMNYPEASKFFTQLVKIKKADCKRLALEENNQGHTPLHSYFYRFKDSLTEYQFVNFYSPHGESPAKTFALTQMIPKAISQLKLVTQQFAVQLGIDITRRFGMESNGKDTAKELMQSGGISKANYEKLINMTYFDKVYSEKNEGKVNSKSKNTEEFNEYCYIIDKRKQEMGLIKVKEASGSGSRYNRRRRRWTNDSSDEEEEESEEDDEDNNKPDKQAKIEIDDYYTDDSLSNVLHMVLQVISSMSKQRDESKPASNLEKVEALFIDILKMSKLSADEGKKKEPKGFNKTDKKGKTIMVKVLEKGFLDLACKMVETQTLDLTVQQHETGLSPIHIIAANITDHDVLTKILASIDRKLLFIKDKNGNTALHYAAYKRNIVMCQVLCESAKVDVNLTNKFGFSPLHMSIFAFNEKLDHTPAFEKYLLKKGADPCALDLDKRSPLFYLFFKHKTPEKKVACDPASILMAILKTGSLTLKDYDQKDRTGNTIVHYACMVGATICTLTMFNYGFSPNTLNLIGNSPYAMALSHGQQQICTFLIQNGCSSGELVSYLKENEKNENLNNLKKLVLPKDLQKDIFENDGKDKLNDAERIAKDYTIKTYTPFYQAMNEGWGGIGYLLFSKNIDPFQALTGCLKSHKYENFLDLLDTAPSNITKQKDDKGRNLLLILLRHLGESGFNRSSKELKRAIEVVSFLTEMSLSLTSKTSAGSNDDGDDDANMSSNSEESEQEAKKPPAKLKRSFSMASKQSPRLSIYSTDDRGYNILHTLASQGDIGIFFEFLLHLPNDLALTLIKQKETAKIYCSPLVLLYESLYDGEAEKFVDLLLFVKSKYGAKEFKTIPFDKLKKQESQSTDIPDYLNFDRPLMHDDGPTQANGGTHQQHMVMSLLCHYADLMQLSNEKMLEIFTLMKPFFEQKDSRGRTMLINLVINNSNPLFRNFLLGATYIKEDNEFKFSKKSTPLVNLNVQDKRGRTALHYAIEPSAKFAGKGFRLDVTAIQTLVKYGAKVNVQDNKGISPLDLAKQNQSISSILQSKDVELLQCKEHLVKKAAKQSFVRIEARAYTADSDRFLAQQIDQIKANQMIVDDGVKKPEVPADKHDDLANCEVVQSEVLTKNGDSKLYYDVTLIKIDVKASYYGTNVFYVIQLLHDKAKDLYLLWTRWGRIGDFGQYQRTPFPTLMQAQMEFEKVFRQKSGNKWADVNTFVNVPKRYKLRQLSGKTVYMTADMRVWQTAEAKVDLSKVFLNFSDHMHLKKSHLSQDELSFVTPLVNSATLLRKFKKQDYGDNLLWECLLDRKVLQNLIQTLEDLIETQQNLSKFEKEKEFSDYSQAMQRKFDLLNAYYELSTPTEFAYDKMQDFYDVDQIMAEVKRLTGLRDLEQASQLLLASAYNMKTTNPYDYCFKNMDCKLKTVPKDTDTYALLMRYINASQTRHQNELIMQNIFEVRSEKSQPASSLFDDTHHHTMLFHGTSNANLISILEQGLQMKPRNAAFYHGSAHGEGIYFADQFNLAVKYSDKGSQEDFFVLVCEVALGNAMNSLCQYNVNGSGYFCSKDDYAKGYHSVRIMGQHGPNFDQNWVQKGSDRIWPLGNVIEYDQPVFKFKNEECNKLGEIIKASEPKKKLKAKKVTKQQRKKYVDSDDNDITDESDDEDMSEEFSGKEGKLWESVQVQPIRKMVSTIVPNQVHHLARDSDNDYINWSSDFNYYMDESQYIVANPDQVRVRYIIQVRNKK